MIVLLFFGDNSHWIFWIFITWIIDITVSASMNVMSSYERVDDNDKDSENEKYVDYISEASIYKRLLIIHDHFVMNLVLKNQ